MDSRAPETDDAELPAPPQTPTLTERGIALIEVLLCSDYPTQIALAGTFAAFGFRPQSGGALSLSYVATLSLLDTVALTALIVFFLRARGESPREVFFGDRSLASEA